MFDLWDLSQGLSSSGYPYSWRRLAEGERREQETRTIFGTNISLILPRQLCSCSRRTFFPICGVDPMLGHTVSNGC